MSSMKRPNKRILVFNNDLQRFIPIEEDMELQEQERIRQRIASDKALGGLDDEPTNDPPTQTFDPTALD